MIEETAFFSEKGDREINQDALYASAKSDRGIFVVADGMGGHSHGEAASGAIVNGIKGWWEKDIRMSADLKIEQVAEQCGSVLHHINAEMYSYFSERGEMGGSTVAVLILWEDRFFLLWAGDSRIYRVREKSLQQLTTDDVWENLPEVKYKTDPEKAAGDARYGRLTQALGSDKRLRINQNGGMLAGRDVFLLCSDGVHKYCPHQELERFFMRGKVFGSAERIKERLRKRIMKSCADDNYSAIICKSKLQK